MHRWRIVAAGTLVSAMTVLAYQVVSGVPSGAGAQSSFCTTGQRLQSEIQDLENVDIGTLSIANFRSRYRRFADLIKQLDKQAPPELENAFKRLRRFYGKVADGKIDLDITSVESMRRFARDVNKAGKDVAKIYRYLEDDCGITIEAPTTT